jgi:hypothetical protein
VCAGGQVNSRQLIDVNQMWFEINVDSRRTRPISGGQSRQQLVVIIPYATALRLPSFLSLLLLLSLPPFKQPPQLRERQAVRAGEGANGELRGVTHVQQQRRRVGLEDAGECLSPFARNPKNESKDHNSRRGIRAV